MAVSPCITSVTTSNYMDQYSQAASSSSTENDRLSPLSVEKQLAAFIQQLTSNVSSKHFGNQQPVNRNVDLPMPPGENTQIAMNPQNPSCAINSQSMLNTNLGQVQQLVLLLSSLNGANSFKNPEATLPSSMTSSSPLLQNSSGVPEPRITSSQNILQQLLSGTDMCQVRSRSELIDQSIRVKEETAGPTAHDRSKIVLFPMQSPVVSNYMSTHAPQQQSALAALLPNTALLNALQFPAATTSYLSSSVPQSMNVSDQLLSILVELERRKQIITATNHVLRLNGESMQSPITHNLSQHSFHRTSVQPDSNNIQQINSTPLVFSHSNSPFVSYPIATSIEAGASKTPNQTQDAFFPDNGFIQARPRCHSDLQYKVQDRRRSHRVRPRSYSKTEHSSKQTVSEKEDETIAREWKSSLFAQLVLSSDSSPQMGTTERSEATDVERANSTDSDLSKGPQVTAHNSQCLPGRFVCGSQVRGRVFELLREADLFVAEHCCEIPLGTLLASAISPGRSALAELCSTFVTPSNAEPISSTARRAVAKCWHHLLLISLMENGIIPYVSTGLSPEPANIPPDVFPEVKPSSMQNKLLNALSSLANLEVEEPPPVDTILLNDMTNLIKTSRDLQLNAAVYKSMRYCILAQNAYPCHFSTSYLEALSELESVCANNHSSDSSLYAQALKLLNRLHCFDSGTLRQFFCLATDTPSETIRSNSSLFRSTACSPAKVVTSNGDSNGAFKRKACHGSLAQLVFERDPSPVQLRSRAYTTNSFNKSARKSGRGCCDSSVTRPSAQD